MPFVMVRHRIKNFGNWKPVFDEHRAARQAGGCLSERIFRYRRDPNEVMLLFEWDSLERAARFLKSDELTQAMDRAGVLDVRENYFLDEVRPEGLAVAS